MNGEIGRALRIWLVARTALATVLLGLATTVFMPEGKPGLGATPSVLLGIVAMTIMSSFVVASLVARGASAERLGAVLLALDVAGVTLAVAMTGAAASVLTVLYGALIVASATAIGGRATFVAGGLSLAAYGAVGFGMAWAYLPLPPDQPPIQYELSTRDLLFSVLSNVTAMLVVTLLANGLASQLRRAGGALAESEERRRALAMLHESIVRSIGSGILTVDTRGVVTSANPAAEELLGAASDRIVGRSLGEFFPSLTIHQTRAEERAETPARRSDDSTFPAGYSLAPLERGDDGTSGTLVAFQDLTEIRRLEKAAQDAERLATLGRVAATLAHEIRNPLGSISGCVELVREATPLDGENAKLLGLVIREVERLDELVEAMLDVARRSEPRFAAFDLVALVRDVCTMASVGLGADARVTAAPDMAETFTLVADSGMIRQVLWNLVKNAIQSSGDGAEVELALGRLASGAFLEVRDRGPGIPEDERDRIFDAFHTRRTRGVGLGLALVKQLVEAHRGTIRVEPREDGVGSSFRIELPELGATPTSRDSIRLSDPPQV